MGRSWGRAVSGQHGSGSTAESCRYPGAVPGRDRGVRGNGEGRGAVQSGEQQDLLLHPFRGGCRGGALRGCSAWGSWSGCGEPAGRQICLKEKWPEELLSEQNLTLLQMASVADFSFLLATPS